MRKTLQEAKELTNSRGWEQFFLLNRIWGKIFWFGQFSEFVSVKRRCFQKPTLCQKNGSYFSMFFHDWNKKEKKKKNTKEVNLDMLNTKLFIPLDSHPKAFSEHQWNTFNSISLSIIYLSIYPSICFEYLFTEQVVDYFTL